MSRGGRLANWQALRVALRDGGDRPIYLARRRTEHLQYCLARCPRDPRRPDDVDTTSNLDHALDALAYGYVGVERGGWFVIH